MPSMKRFQPIDILSTKIADQHLLLISGESDDQISVGENGLLTAAEIMIWKNKSRHRTFRFWLTKESAAELRDNLNKILEVNEG